MRDGLLFISQHDLIQMLALLVQTSNFPTARVRPGRAVAALHDKRAVTELYLKTTNSVLVPEPLALSARPQKHRPHAEIPRAGTWWPLLSLTSRRDLQARRQPTRSSSPTLVALCRRFHVKFAGPAATLRALPAAPKTRASSAHLFSASLLISTRLQGGGPPVA